MKKICLLVVLFLLVQQSFACEFCGCSSGNYFISPFPKFNKYFVGTRYTFRSFHTTLEEDPSEFSKDFYQTVEIWGGVNLGKKWQVLGFLPYSINRQNSDDGLSETKGMGDITFIVNYNVFTANTAQGVKHAVYLGGGVKLPTGKYSVDEDEFNASANNQPGTGSTDFITNAMYSVSINQWTVNATANYKINQSADGFQFGNRLAISGFVYRSLTHGTVTWNPSLGILHEDLGTNKFSGVKVEDTGGYSLLAAAGMDTNIKKVTVGFNVQLPVSEHYSAGQTNTKIRGMVHVTFAF